MSYVWDTTPAEDLGRLNAAVTAVLASGITAEKVNALAELVDSGAKNVLNIDTDYTTGTHRGATYTNNNDGTFTVTTDSSGTSANDSYIQLFNITADNVFGIGIGEKIIIKSSSDIVSLNFIPKVNGTYESTILGYDSAPAEYTIPTGFNGFLIRLGIWYSGTVVDNETVSAMICTKAAWDVSQTYQPYRPSYQELVARVEALENPEAKTTTKKEAAAAVDDRKEG